MKITVKNLTYNPVSVDTFKLDPLESRTLNVQNSVSFSLVGTTIQGWDSGVYASAPAYISGSGSAGLRFIDCTTGIAMGSGSQLHPSGVVLQGFFSACTTCISAAGPMFVHVISPPGSVTSTGNTNGNGAHLTLADSACQDSRRAPNPRRERKGQRMNSLTVERGPKVVPHE